MFQGTEPRTPDPLMPVVHLLVAKEVMQSRNRKHRTKGTKRTRSAIWAVSENRAGPQVVTIRWRPFLFSMEEASQ